MNTTLDHFTSFAVLSWLARHVWPDIVVAAFIVYQLWLAVSVLRMKRWLVIAGLAVLGVLYLANVALAVVSLRKQAWEGLAVSVAALPLLILAFRKTRGLLFRWEMNEIRRRTDDAVRAARLDR